MNVTGLILLAVIFIVVLLYFVYKVIWGSIRLYTQQIQKNTTTIREMEKTLKYKDDFYGLEKRISLLEVKNAKKRSN